MMLRNWNIRRWQLIGLIAVAVGSPVRSAWGAERAAWMQEARWGVMTHFLADWIARETGEPMSIERWNQLVDGFDVEKVAEQLQSVGAGYYLISIGQNSGYYLSPNATYDRFVGITPTKCSRRDLVADLHPALQKRGIRLMVYLPSGAPNSDQAAEDALQWRNGPYPNREFQVKWEQVIREWSVRWGDTISGWWFDGCYWPNTMYRADEPPNFASFAAAARAGNPASALAFCPGVIYRVTSITPHEDYIAGEVIDLERWDPNPNRIGGGKIDGAQIHVLSRLGVNWGRGAPRYTTEQVATFSGRVASYRGAVTWDVPVRTNGEIPPEFIEQLKAIDHAVRNPPPLPAPQRGRNQPPSAAPAAAPQT